MGNFRKQVAFQRQLAGLPPLPSSKKLKDHKRKQRREREVRVSVWGQEGTDKGRENSISTIRFLTWSRKRLNQLPYLWGFRKEENVFPDNPDQLINAAGTPADSGCFEEVEV